MLFDVDSYVVSVRFALVYLVQLSLEQEYLDGCNSTADTGDAEDGRKEYRKQVPQNEDEKAETDQQQSNDEKTGREVSGGLGYRICIKTKAHFRVS